MKNIITLLLPFVFFLGCNPPDNTILVRGYKALHAINLVTTSMSSVSVPDEVPDDPNIPDDGIAPLLLEIETFKLKIADLEKKLESTNQSQVTTTNLEFVTPYKSIRLRGRRLWLCKDGVYRTDKLPLLSYRFTQPSSNYYFYQPGCTSGRCR